MSRVREPRVLVWEGQTDPHRAGSLAYVNLEVTSRLPRYWGGPVVVVEPMPRGVARVGLPEMAARASVWVSHYWDPKGWNTPAARDVPWAIVAPWEYDQPVPAAWTDAWEHPQFRRLFTPSVHASILLGMDGYGGPPRDRIVVVPNGVDTKVFSAEAERGWVKDGRQWFGVSWTALFVGGLIERKGLRMLYDAWRLSGLDREDDTLLLLKAQGGQGFYAGQEIMPPDGLSRVSIDSRMLSKYELAFLYRCADVVVQPYRAEGFCLPLLEAMASEKPVICPEYGPAMEFVPQGAGLFVPSKDDFESDGYPAPAVSVEGLARALRWCYDKSHASRLREMGACGRAAALTYDWDRVVARYAEHLHTLSEG